MCKFFRSLIVVMFIFCVNMTMTGVGLAKTNSDTYVRTASYFLMSGPVLNQNLEKLAHFDLLIIPVEAQVYNKTFFRDIRKLNPDILILPYIPTVSWNDLYWTDPLHESIYPNIKPEWWLKSGDGKQISVWPHTRALNLNTGWSEHLAKHVQNDVLSTGFWDGVFYDEVQDSISWVGETDVDQDERADTPAQADALWAASYQKLFTMTRARIGDKLMVINGSSNPDFSPLVNGRMFETFPSSHHTLAQWKNQTTDYLNFGQKIGETIQVVNVNTDNTTSKRDGSDYQAMRFGLTTTLLGNGYFSYDQSVSNHATIWQYDEYETYLGAPKNSPTNLLEPRGSSLDVGVWQRDFAQGKVIVNATDQDQMIKLTGEFEKLHGTQDPYINDGSIGSRVMIASKDGIVLLRPIEHINDATFLNGSFARIFSSNGKQQRTGFFAYESGYRGGVQVVRYDLDGDGTREFVVAGETFVSTYQADGSLRATFAPYGETYHRGINISVGDIENDDSVEIVTGTENGGGPQVRIFNQDGRLINPGFFAFAKNFRGGVNVAIGDLNGDSIKEIICGAGYGGGPHVRVFKKNGTLINPGFFAYEKDFRGGVNVSVGDVDGDGIDEIVTGPGLGGSPQARVYDKDGKKKSEFYVFDKEETRGLKPVVSDIDGDGKAEVIGLTTNVFTMSGNEGLEVGGRKKKTQLYETD